MPSFDELTTNTAQSGEAVASRPTSSKAFCESESIATMPMSSAVGAAVKLVFTEQPIGTSAGASLGGFSVAAEDSNGNIVTSDTSYVTVFVNGSNFAGGDFLVRRLQVPGIGIYRVEHAWRTAADIAANAQPIDVFVGRFGAAGNTDLRAFQASPRGGELTVRQTGDRVLLTGLATTILAGELRA